MENMLGQLIGMVGAMSKEIKEIKVDIAAIKVELASMKEDITDMKAEQASMKTDLADMKTENEVRHLEILKRFSTMEADHNLIWGKAVNNERDIAKMKTHVFPHNNF